MRLGLQPLQPGLGPVKPQPGGSDGRVLFHGAPVAWVSLLLRLLHATHAGLFYRETQRKLDNLGSLPYFKTYPNAVKDAFISDAQGACVHSSAARSKDITKNDVLVRNERESTCLSGPTSGHHDVCFFAGKLQNILA